MNRQSKFLGTASLWIVGVLLSCMAFAEEVPLEGFSMETISGDPNLDDAAAGFGEVSVGSTDLVMQIPVIFEGNASSNVLTVTFTTTSGETTLPLLMPLSTLDVGRLDYLSIDSESVAGQTGTLTFTLVNTATTPGVTSELFLVDVAKSRETTPSAFVLTSLPMPAVSDGDKKSGGGGTTTFPVLMLLGVLGLRRRIRQRPALWW